MRSLGLVRAIGIAGTQEALAKAIRGVAPTVKQQHISYWLAHGVPLRRAQQIIEAFPEVGPLSVFFADADALAAESNG